jgi:hypothetical protein
MAQLPSYRPGGIVDIHKLTHFEVSIPLRTLRTSGITSAGTIAANFGDCRLSGAPTLQPLVGGSNAETKNLL